MSLAAFSSAVTISFASTILFLLIVRSWETFIQAVVPSTRFPKSIMAEAAQRFRDEMKRLVHEQSLYLIAVLVFAVIFVIAYVLPTRGLLDDLSHQQLTLLLMFFGIAALYVTYRLIRIVAAKRHLAFVRDANMATGHALHKLTISQNRVFHDVPCGPYIIDNVIVSVQGIYAISVIARTPGKHNRVSLRHDKLTFCESGKSISISRSGAKSVRLAEEIGRVVKHDVRVRSVIAMPGWEIESQVSDEYLIVNERNLAMLGGWKDQQDFLMTEDVTKIHAMLTARCRRFR